MLEDRRRAQSVKENRWSSWWRDVFKAGIGPILWLLVRILDRLLGSRPV